MSEGPEFQLASWELGLLAIIREAAEANREQVIDEGNDEANDEEDGAPNQCK